MLAQKLKDLMRLPEPRWDAPRPVDTAYGGGAGSPRVLLFSGLDSGEKSTLVSAMEARGLPRLCVTSHSPGNTNSRLGTVLAEAVQADRLYWQRLQALRQGKPLPLEDLMDDEEELGSGGGAAAAAADDNSAGAEPNTVGDAAPAGASSADAATTSTPWPEEPSDDLARHVQRIHAELQRRAAAGEDLSFMEDPEGENEPEWMKELLAHRSLDRYVSGPELEEMLAQRQDFMDGAEADGGAAGGGGQEEGFGTLDELMAAITAKSEELAAAPPPGVYGPEAPPNLRG